MKILAIKFKFLGDVAVTIPALRALRQAYPNAELHFLVSEEAVPVIEYTPWIDKVWGYPRKKNQGTKQQALSIIRALRKEKFDLSIDFVGNDRGAWMSLAIGAQNRLGEKAPRGFLGRKYCYTYPMSKKFTDHIPEIDRGLELLSLIGVAKPNSLEPELFSNPKLKNFAQSSLPTDAILCHLSASAASKEWPVANWVDLYKQCPELHHRFVFSSGPSLRERKLLDDLSKQIPQAQTIKEVLSLEEFMALINYAHTVICGDTFSAHAAAGLKTPALVLFGPSLAKLWNPKGNSIIVEAQSCKCRHSVYKCTNDTHCLSSLPAKQIHEALMLLLERTKNSIGNKCDS